MRLSNNILFIKLVYSYFGSKMMERAFFDHKYIQSHIIKVTPRFAFFLAKKCNYVRERRVGRSKRSITVSKLKRNDFEQL